MSTSQALDLAEFLLGDKDLSHVVVRAALEAAVLDAMKYDDTRRKRERIDEKSEKKGSPDDEDDEDDEPPRLTAHYGTRSQLVQRQVIRFAELVAWAHEAKFFDFRDSESFQKAKEIEPEYEELAACALGEQLVPTSNVLLLRRYAAAVIPWRSWPDTGWLAVGVWSVLRGYPGNERRLTAITKDILHGRRVTKDTSRMRKRIKEHLGARFSHLGPNVADFGADGLGYEYAPGSEEHNQVLSALSKISPWGVPCFASLPTVVEHETFPEVFWRALNDPAYGVSSRAGGVSGWFRRAPKDAYPDDEGRRGMYRAHALLCPDCFEKIAADYERTEVIPYVGPSRTRAQGAGLRLPRFSLPCTAEEEVIR